MARMQIPHRTGLSRGGGAAASSSHPFVSLHPCVRAVVESVFCMPWILELFEPQTAPVRLGAAHCPVQPWWPYVSSAVVHSFASPLCIVTQALWAGVMEAAAVSEEARSQTRSAGLHIASVRCRRSSGDSRAATAAGVPSAPIGVGSAVKPEPMDCIPAAIPCPDQAAADQLCVGIASGISLAEGRWRASACKVPSPNCCAGVFLH